jgi:hypothetical protein
MTSMIAPLAAVICVLMILGTLRGPVRCPRCLAMMRWIRKPANLRQRLWGGWTCPHCQCEMNRHGRAID